MKHTFSLLLALVALFSFSSCLRDTEWEEQKHGLRIEDLENKKIIEIYSVKTNVDMSVLADQPTREIKLFTVHLAAKDVASEDIVVSLGTTYEGLAAGVAKFPQAEISVPATVTIKAGERDAEVVGTIKTGKLTADPQSIRIGITGVNNPGYIVSGNYGYQRFNFLQRSVYEGTYRYEVLENLAYPKYDVYIAQGAEDYYLSTVNATTVRGAALYGVFSDEVEITFDPATNKVVNVVWIDWDVWKVRPEESTYDAATKTYQYTMRYNNGNTRITTKLTRLD